MNDEPRMTFDQLVEACKNIGYDLNCGQCASVFFTGVGNFPHEHNCATRTMKAKKRSWAFLRSGFAFSVIVAACLGVFLGLLVSGMRTEMCLVLSVIVCIGTCVITDALSCIGNDESKD